MFYKRTAQGRLKWVQQDLGQAEYEAPLLNQRMEEILMLAGWQKDFQKLVGGKFNFVRIGPSSPVFRYVNH